MLVSIDFGEPVEVLHSVKAIIGDGDELHINVTADGVIYDRISGGEVVRTQCVFVDDILPEAVETYENEVSDAMLAIIETVEDWSDEKVLAVKKFVDSFGRRSST